MAKLKAWVTMDQYKDDDRYYCRLFMGTEAPTLEDGWWVDWGKGKVRDCDEITFHWRLPKLFAKGLKLKRGECVEVELPRLKRRKA